MTTADRHADVSGDDHLRKMMPDTLADINLLSSFTPNT